MTSTSPPATATVAVTQGKAVTILQTDADVTGEAAAEAIERWEASKVKDIACTNGVPDDAKIKSTPLGVLICRARYAAGGDLQVSAIEALGALGDMRAAPVLITISQDGEGSRPARLAALTALAKLKSPAPAAAPAKTDDAEDAPKPKAELITGPAEHWFLSADVPLNDVKAFTFDKDTNQVALGDEPSTFYIGINFLVGDIKEGNRPFLGNLVFKAMLKASQHPLDSIGAGIGLRGQYFTKWGLNLDALTPFAVYTMTQEDVTENGVVKKRARRNSEFRFGVSLNLDQAIKWVGGK